MKLPLIIITLLCLISHNISAENSKKVDSEKVSYSRDNKINDSYELAAKAFAQGEVNEAFIHVKNVLQQKPNHLPSKLLISKLYFDAGNMEAVAEELYEALELGADINLVLPMLGSALVVQENVRGILALEEYQRSFNLASKFEWQMLQGQANLINGDEFLAQYHFEQAQIVLPNDTRALNTLATMYMAQGWLDKAEKLTNKSLEINQGNEKTWLLKGELALTMNDDINALSAFEQAYAIDETDPKVMRKLLMMHLKRQNLLEVKKFIELILAQSPDEPSVVLIKAGVLLAENDKAQAEKLLKDLSVKLTLLDESALAKDPSLNMIRGSADFIQGNYQSARQFLDIYLNEIPNDLRAIQMLYEINKQENQTQKNIELLEKHQEIIINDLALTSQLVQLYINDSKFLAAESFLDKINDIYKSDALITYYRAQIARARNRPEEAISLLEQLSYDGEPPINISLLQGALNLQLNNITKAETIAEQLIQKTEKNVDVLNYIAAVYIKLNKISEAQSYLKQALTMEPKNISARYNQALIARMNDDESKFKAIINSILSENREHTPSLLLLAREALQSGKGEVATGITGQILLYDNKNTSALGLQLIAYKQQQNWAAALTVAEQLNAIERLNPDYLIELINLNIKLKYFNATKRYFNILLSLWNDDVEKLLYLAQLQAGAEQPDEALQTLKRVRELNPNSFETSLTMSKLYFTLNKVETAENLLKGIESKFGNKTEVIILKGDIANQQGDLVAAKNRYTEALKLTPNYYGAIIKLYQLTLSGVGAAEFLVLVEDVISKNTAPNFVRKLLADSYLNQGLIPQAQAHYEALAMIPALANERSILNNLANIYAEHDLEKALDTANKISEKDRKTPAVLDTLGWILAKLERYSEALPLLREAYSMNATSGEIKYHLGYTLLKLGRKAEAIVELKAAVKNGHTFKEYQAAMTLLEKL